MQLTGAPVAGTDACQDGTRRGMDVSMAMGMGMAESGSGIMEEVSSPTHHECRQFI
jgi:hypothetical protein